MNRHFKHYQPDQGVQPNKDKCPMVFLAGSSNVGTSPDWQKETAAGLRHLAVAVYNPRCDSFDMDLVQDISCPGFLHQVTWELDNLKKVDIIAVYLRPDTEKLSPFTLLQIGLYAASGKLIIYCPEGYRSRGNIQIICDQYKIPLLDTRDELVMKVEAAIARRQWEMDRPLVRLLTKIGESRDRMGLKLKEAIDTGRGLVFRKGVVVQEGGD